MYVIYVVYHLHTCTGKGYSEWSGARWTHTTHLYIFIVVTEYVAKARIQFRGNTYTEYCLGSWIVYTYVTSVS